MGSGQNLGLIDTMDDATNKHYTLSFIDEEEPSGTSNSPSPFRLGVFISTTLHFLHPKKIRSRQEAALCFLASHKF